MRTPPGDSTRDGADIVFPPPQATPGSCRSTGSSPVETLVEETSHKSVSPSIRGTMASSCEGEQHLSRPPHLP